jgi:hypothetical protein
MKNVLAIAVALVLMAASLAVAQTGQAPKTPAEVQADVAKTQAIKTKIDDAQTNPRFVRTLTNVQIELTLTDQQGTSAPEKKTVSMIVSSGSWGKIRAAGSVLQIGDAPYGVDLGVDARPFVSTDGPVQLELVLNYAPPKGAADPREPRQRPTGINQSQTFVLTSGKPMIISQAADPLSDRKVVVEVKATVLK